MDANQIEKLKALALAATAGPWAANNWTCHAPTTIKSDDIVVAETMGFGRHSSECAIDAAYIAEANPAAVLELIAEVERLHAAPAAGTLEKDAAGETSLEKIRSAIADYYRALNARQHGEVAMDRAFRAIEREAGMSWDIWTRAEAHTKAGKANA